MRVRRILSIPLLAALSLTVFPLIAQSAQTVKAGAVCKTLNQKVTNDSKVYTCSKSGKKLIWSKGFAIKNPTLTPTSIPSPIPTPTLTPTPSPSATVLPTSINSFAELPNRISDIQYLAWMTIQKTINQSPVQDSPIEITVEANTTKFSEKTSESVRLVQKIFHDSKLPSKAWMIYYTLSDQASNSWATSEFSRLMGNMSKSNSLSPRANSSNEAIVPLSLPNDDFTKSGGTEAHEYLHAVQFAQFVGSNKSPYVAPRWLFEGGGQFIQDYIMYGSSFKDWVLKTSGSQLKTYDLKFFEEFLTYNFPIIVGPDGDPWFYTSAWPNQRVYDVGALVYQVLIAINGPAHVMALFKDMSVTGNLDSSFKNIYGISWSEAKPNVARAIFGIVNR
jgi:hypothetical protein